MKTTIYLDVLLLVNLLVNFLLISASASFAKCTPKTMRMFLSTLLATATSLFIFLPSLGAFGSLLLKLAIAAVVTLCAFGFGGVWVYLKNLGIFLGVNFAFAGIMIGIWMFSSSPRIYANNGVFYIDLSFVTLMISTVVSYCLIEIGCKIVKHQPTKNEFCKVRVTQNHQSVDCQAFVDNGNSLTDLLTGLPVVVAWYPKLQSILPKQVDDYLRRGDVEQTKSHHEFHLIPYHGVGGAGLLPAFVPDCFEIVEEDGTAVAYRVMVAISKEKLRQGEFDILLNREMQPCTAQKECMS